MVVFVLFLSIVVVYCYIILEALFVLFKQLQLLSWIVYYFFSLLDEDSFVMLVNYCLVILVILFRGQN